jgi:hypothetical protein
VGGHWIFPREAEALGPHLSQIGKKMQVHETSNSGNVAFAQKRPVKGDGLYVSAKMIPDGYAGPEGSPTNYISFDLDTAIRIRDHLDECIDIVRRYSAADPH